MEETIIRLFECSLKYAKQQKTAAISLIQHGLVIASCDSEVFLRYSDIEAIKSEQEGFCIVTPRTSLLFLSNQCMKEEVCSIIYHCRREHGVRMIFDNPIYPKVYLATPTAMVLEQDSTEQTLYRYLNSFKVCPSLTLGTEASINTCELLIKQLWLENPTRKISQSSLQDNTLKFYSTSTKNMVIIAIKTERIEAITCRESPWQAELLFWMNGRRSPCKLEAFGLRLPFMIKLLLQQQPDIRLHVTGTPQTIKLPDAVI